MRRITGVHGSLHATHWLCSSLPEGSPSLICHASCASLCSRWHEFRSACTLPPAGLFRTCISFFLSNPCEGSSGPCGVPLKWPDIVACGVGVAGASLGDECAAPWSGRGPRVCHGWLLSARQGGLGNLGCAAVCGNHDLLGWCLPACIFST